MDRGRIFKIIIIFSIILIAIVFSIKKKLDVNVPSVSVEPAVVDSDYIKLCHDKGGQIVGSEIDIEAANTSHCTNANILERNLPRCKYAKEYETRDACECDGHWSIYPLNDGVSCGYKTDKRVYVCREMEDKKVRGDVMLSLSGASFEQALEIVEEAGAKVRKYPCEWNEKFVLMKVETLPGEEDILIERLEANPYVKSAEQNEKSMMILP